MLAPREGMVLRPKVTGLKEEKKDWLITPVFWPGEPAAVLGKEEIE